MRIFKKKSTPLPYDKINKKPVVKASICNGEQGGWALKISIQEK